MNTTRVVPVLLLKGRGLVKTVKFKEPRYIGDPINSVRIFNEKEVDELVFLDIGATPGNQEPNFELLSNISGEAFMPMAYGGGIKTLEHIRKIFSIGFEKIVINSSGYNTPELIQNAVDIYGSQSIVGSIDARRNLLGRYELYSHSGRTRQTVGLLEHAKALEGLGVGEIIINSIDRDGTLSGYDLKLIKQVSSTVSVPVVACGGASSIDDFVKAVDQGGATAVGAGSLFVYMGPHRAVLINYPNRTELFDRLP